MEARLKAVFKSEEDFSVLEKFKGKTLENKGCIEYMKRSLHLFREAGLKTS